MHELVMSEVIITLLNATRSQVDVITGLSSAGLGVIILTWARILGIVNDADLSAFRRPAFLILPTILLLLAVTVGYLIGSLTTGYLTEIANGINASSGNQILNARLYYFQEYGFSFHVMMSIQLYSSIVGIMLIAGWFTWNISKRKGKMK